MSSVYPINTPHLSPDFNRAVCVSYRKISALFFESKRNDDLIAHSQKIDYSLNNRVIYLKACQPPFNSQSSPTFELNPELLSSLKITQEEVKELFTYWVTIASDPYQILSLLKDIDKELGELIPAIEIAPCYLIAGKGQFWPGPPENQNLLYPKKKRLLDSLLLKREQKNGINNEGTPVFIGPVKHEEGNKFVQDFHIFMDYNLGVFTLHGKYSHRLFFHALIESLKNHPVGCRLRPKDILTLIVKTQVTYKNAILTTRTVNGWLYLFDYVGDKEVNIKNNWTEQESKMYHPSDLYHIPEYFSFNCRSPFAFNSLILCFGKKFSLPNLQKYLLDSFWKDIYKKADRISLSENRNALYNTVIESLTCHPNGPDSIDTKFSFDLIQWKKYTYYSTTNAILGIMKRHIPK